ncbi:MAG TPA: HIT domain-containing protein [Solirubrobacteraceae bacterium]|jgi:ATP adenylyltransferase
MSERPLWAPWRIEYITGPKGGKCVFCHPGAALERGTHCFTMLNAYPYAPGHVMVAPYRHVAGLDELDDDELLDMMRLARRAVLAVKQAMAPAGFNTGLNLGKVAGAGIAEHLHMHVVPRWEGDFNFMPLLADTHVIPEALDATREQLTEALRKLE